MKILTEGFERYLRDESNTESSGIDAVYIPEGSSEIEELLRKNGRFTLYAGGTGIAGGATSDGGSIISTENLKFLQIDSHLMQVTAGAGVLLKDLNAELAKNGLWYPVDSTEQTATVGGNAATNAWGARSYGYGSIRNFINAVHIIVPGQPQVRISRDCAEANGLELPWKVNMSGGHGLILPGAGGKNVLMEDTAARLPYKNNAGYFMKKDMDFVDILIGSEGTLGVITMVELEVKKMPYEICVFMMFFNNLDAAFNLVKNVKAGSHKYQPCSLEIMDGESLKLLREKGKNIGQAGAAVFMEYEAGSEKEEMEINDAVYAIASGAGIDPDDVMVSSTKEKKNYIYDIRESLPQAVNEHIRARSLRKVSTDFAVNDDKFDSMTDLYRVFREKSAMRSVMFGHAGDNNLHINFLPENPAEYEKARELYDEMAAAIGLMGGTVAAEHGVGKMKKAYLKYMYKESTMDVMRNIKKAFDPDNKLNRGNIL